MNQGLTLAREIVRQQVPKVVFHVFNWTFISFIQSILLFMISAPVYTILLASTIEPNVTASDLAYLAVELGLVVTEYIADEQQWGMHMRTCLLNERPVQADRFDSQLTKLQSSSTEPRPRSRAASSKPTWTAASSARASGDTADTPTSRPSSPSGSSSTSGAATPPRRCTTGPAWGRRSSSCSSRARPG